MKKKDHKEEKRKKQKETEIVIVRQISSEPEFTKIHNFAIANSNCHIGRKFFFYGGRGLRVQKFPSKQSRFYNSLFEFDFTARKFKTIMKDCTPQPGEREGNSLIFRTFFEDCREESPELNLFSEEEKELLFTPQKREQLVLFGGYHQKNRRFSNDLIIYDFSSNKWIQRNFRTPPPIMSFHCSLYKKSNDTMIIFSGKIDELERSNMIYLCDFKKRKWRVQIPSNSVCPDGRSSSSMNWYDEKKQEKFVVFGGYTELKYNNDVWIFDLQNKEWTQCVCSGSSPTPRSSHCSCVYNQNLYIFGGSGGRKRYFNDLYCLDMKTMVWNLVLIEGAIPPSLRDMKSGLVFDMKKEIRNIILTEEEEDEENRNNNDLLIIEKEKNEEESQEDKEEEFVYMKRVNFLVFGGRDLYYSKNVISEFRIDEYEISEKEYLNNFNNKISDEEEDEGEDQDQENENEKNEKNKNKNKELSFELELWKKKVLELSRIISTQKNDLERKEKEIKDKDTKILDLENQNVSFKQQIVHILQQMQRSNQENTQKK